MQRFQNFIEKHKRAILALAAALVVISLTVIYAVPMYRNYVNENKIRMEINNIQKEVLENVSQHNNQIYDNPLLGSISLNLTPQVGVIALYLHPANTIYFPALKFSLTPPNGTTTPLLWCSSIYPYGWTIVNETPQYFGFEIQYISDKGLYWTQVYNSTMSKIITIWVAPPKAENLAGFNLSISYMLGSGNINYTFPENTPTPIFEHAS